MRSRLAFACHLAALVVVAVYGLVYLARPTFMPYHAVALGMPWVDVPPAVQTLVLALMRAVGGGLLAVAVMGGLVLWGPFRRGDAWARRVVPLGGLVAVAGSLYATLSVAAHTPASPPWAVAAGTGVLFAAGYALSRPGRTAR